MREVAKGFEDNARKLSDALGAMGLKTAPAEGGYFVIADVSSTGKTAMEFCKWLAETKKVACVPLSLFCKDPSDPTMASLVRFAICKRPSTIADACAKLAAP